MFELDERLRADTVEVVTLGLSVVLLMNDRTLPWLILVPQAPGLRELYDLNAPGRAVMMDEIALASRVMAQVYKPEKLNVANLGNIVAQLHVHIVARRVDDRAWPGPVWGAPGAQSYTREGLEAALSALRAVFRQQYI